MVSFEFIKKSFDLPLKTFETFTNVKKQKVNVGISKKKIKIFNHRLWIVCSATSQTLLITNNYNTLIMKNFGVKSGLCCIYFKPSLFASFFTFRQTKQSFFPLFLYFIMILYWMRWFVRVSITQIHVFE